VLKCLSKLHARVD